MIRTLNVRDQLAYMKTNYGRYGKLVDGTTVAACFDLFNWMNKQEQFDNVRFEPGRFGSKFTNKQIDQLIERTVKDKTVRRKRDTLERCWKILQNDLIKGD